MEQRDPSPPVSGRGTAWYRDRRTVIVAGVAVLAAVAGAGVYVANRPSSTGAAPSGPAATSTAANPWWRRTPRRPRSAGTPRRCPARPPHPRAPSSSAPTQNLHDVTEASPAGTTFYLEAGKHKLGSGAFSQVIPKQGNVYIGAPGAMLDGGRKNRYAFTGYATEVAVKNLTIQNFGPRRTNNDEGVVNHDAAARWTVAGQHDPGERRRRGDGR